MKIGYFSITNLTISETFIYDLVHGLNADKDLEVIYYSGKKNEKPKVDFKLKSVQTGFAERGKRIFSIAYKLGGLIKREKDWKSISKIQKKHSYRALVNSISGPIDIAWIDYADSAMLVREFLNSRKIPFILHVHGYDITSSLNIPGYADELGKVINDAQYIVAASEYMKRLLVLQGANENKIKVIRIGIDVKSIIPISWTERLKENPSIIFLGRLTIKKHPIALLHAFKIVLKTIPHAKLTIIGDGPLRNDVLKRIQKLEIGNSVVFLGSLPREESFPILNNHWVYAQHSVTAFTGDQEGYAISPAEAAAHGLPVVSTIHNGIPEHVIEGKTGYLVPEYNYEAMAEKIIYLLQNPKLAEEFGINGRENIEQINNQEKRIESIKSLFFSLAK